MRPSGWVLHLESSLGCYEQADDLFLGSFWGLVMCCVCITLVFFQVKYDQPKERSLGACETSLLFCVLENVSRCLFEFDFFLF